MSDLKETISKAPPSENFPFKYNVGEILYVDKGRRMMVQSQNGKSLIDNKWIPFYAMCKLNAPEDGPDKRSWNKQSNIVFNKFHETRLSRKK